MLDPGARGGRVFAELPVISGEHLAVFVGGAANGTSGGFNGGGSAKFYTSSGGYGGGGASDIREGGVSLHDRILVVGGGGGQGGFNYDGYGAGGKGGGSGAGSGANGAGTQRAAPARQRVTAETAARSIAVGAAGQEAPEAIKTDRPEPMVRSERAVQELSEAEAMVVAEAAAVTTAAVEVVVAAGATVTTLVAVGAEAAARHTSNRRRENTKVGEVGRPPQETVSSSLVGNE